MIVMSAILSSHDRIAAENALAKP